VKVGRLEDSDKKLASITANGPAEEKPAAVKKALGLDLADINEDLRRKYDIKDNVKGAVVTAVEQNSSAAEKQMKPGDTIVEISQVAVASAADVQKRVDQLKKEGRKSALFLVANKDGETRFVALNLQ
jgi:serine protease Do